MRITIVGTGYVGLVTGTCLANIGNDVTCLDIDQEKIQTLRQNGCPIYEPGLEELIRRNSGSGRLHFTTDRMAAHLCAEVIFICVGTPDNGQGQTDLRAVLGAARDIGEALEAAPGLTGGEFEDRRAKIIVVKSTVPVGTNSKVRDEIAGLTQKQFRMASNPEFLKEGAAITDFQRPDRVVIGVEDLGTGQRLSDLFEPFVRQGNPIFVMDIASAEMVKYASNAMLATKISFINEMANLCERMGADIEEVRRGMCADERIGRRFLYPGLGYGGSCFPKDVLACIQMGREKDCPATLLAAVHDVNQHQRETFVAKLRHHFGSGMRGKRIAVWGIAFKPGTDDIREAPAITIVEHLLREGASVIAHDPAAKDTSRQRLGDSITFADDPTDALDQADALVVCTDWDDFKHPDFEQMKQRMAEPVIFDGRNLYRPDVMREYGFVYYSVGRAPVQG